MHLQIVKETKFYKAFCENWSPQPSHSWTQPLSALLVAPAAFTSYLQVPAVVKDLAFSQPPPRLHAPSLVFPHLSCHSSDFGAHVVARCKSWGVRGSVQWFLSLSCTSFPVNLTVFCLLCFLYIFIFKMSSSCVIFQYLMYPNTFSRLVLISFLK